MEYNKNLTKKFSLPYFYIVAVFRLKDYANRTVGCTDLELSMRKQLTEFEMHLLSSQSLMEIRGKVSF